MGLLDRYTVTSDDFVFTHDPNLAGVFEPVSGLVFLNLMSEDLDALWEWRSDPQPDEEMARIAEVYYHESYHCYQTYTCGYLYQQLLDLCEALTHALKRWGPSIAATLAIDLKNLVLHGLSFWMSTEGRALTRQARDLDVALGRYSKFKRQAERYGVKSIDDALHPRLAARREEIQRASTQRGPEGLSASDVAEGAAFTYARTMAYPELGDPVYDAGLDPSGPYQRLVTFTRELLPGQEKGGASELLFTAAMALRYERPGAAYAALLPEVVASDQDRSAFAAELPVIEAAGRLIGTARDLRAHKPLPSPDVYRPQFEGLDGPWGIDELTVLTTGETQIPYGELGFGIVTRNGYHGFIEEGTMPVRVILASKMIPTSSSIDQLRRHLIPRDTIVEGISRG